MTDIYIEPRYSGDPGSPRGKPMGWGATLTKGKSMPSPQIFDYHCESEEVIQSVIVDLMDEE